MLAIILDLNIDSWVVRSEPGRDGSVQFSEFIESLFAYIGSFILQSHRNQLIVSAYGIDEPYRCRLVVTCRAILFPKCVDNISMNLKIHSQQISNVRKFLFDEINKKMKCDYPVKATLDACLSRTLCYILSKLDLVPQLYSSTNTQTLA